MVECLNVIPRMTLMLIGEPKKHKVFSPQTNDYALESKVISEYDFNNWNGRRAKNVR